MKNKPSKVGQKENAQKDTLKNVIQAFEELKKAVDGLRQDSYKREELDTEIGRIENRIVGEIRDRSAIEHMVDVRAKDAVKDANKKLNTYVACTLFVLALGVWPIMQTYRQYVTDRINDRIVEKEVDRTISQQSATMISNTVPGMITQSVCQTESRLKTEFSDYVSNRVEKIDRNSESLAQTMKLLREKEQELESRLKYIPKMVAARGGSRTEYDDLRRIAKSNGELAAFVLPTIKDIEHQFFEKKIRQDGYSIILRRSDGKRSEPEEYVDLVYADLDHNCDGAINELAGLGRKEFVATLMHAVMNSKRLNSVYLAIAGIEKLAGVSFPAIAVDDVSGWWRVNMTNDVYHSSYEEYRTIACRERERFKDGNVTNCTWATSLLADTQRLIAKDPKFLPAVKSALLQVAFFPGKVEARFDEGRNEIFEQALAKYSELKGKDDFWWNLTAYRNVFFGGFFETVTNRLEKSPTFEGEMKRSCLYNPDIFEQSKFNWPSKRPKPVKPSIPLTPANTIRSVPRSIISSANGPNSQDCVGGVGMVTAELAKGKRVLTEIPFIQSDTIFETLGQKSPPVVVKGDAFSWTLNGVECKYEFDGKVWRSADGKDASSVVLPYGQCQISYERNVEKKTTMTFSGFVNVSN